MPPGHGPHNRASTQGAGAGLQEDERRTSPCSLRFLGIWRHPVVSVRRPEASSTGRTWEAGPCRGLPVIPRRTITLTYFRSRISTRCSPFIMTLPSLQLPPSLLPPTLVSPVAPSLRFLLICKPTCPLRSLQALLLCDSKFQGFCLPGRTPSTFLPAPLEVPPGPQAFAAWASFWGPSSIRHILSEPLLRWVLRMER